jgi:hypothetical protein
MAPQAWFFQACGFFVHRLPNLRSVSLPDPSRTLDFACGFNSQALVLINSYFTSSESVITLLSNRPVEVAQASPTDPNFGYPTWDTTGGSCQ